MTESMQQRADGLITEVLARRVHARENRRKALKSHATLISGKAEYLAAGSESFGLPSLPQIASMETAGYLLAIGDSWFDYPIHNVLTKLYEFHGYSIESSARNGDRVEHMMTHSGQLDNFSKKVEKLVDLGVLPRAILVSGGGNDIAGREFGMLLNERDLALSDWNEQIIAGLIDTRLRAAYQFLVLTVNTLCQKKFQRTFPILVHGYDYPVPDGRGVLGGWGPLPGPWLQPGFDEKCLVSLDENTGLMRILIDRFNVMLRSLNQDPALANVLYVDIRGTLRNTSDEYKRWWANELHPTGGHLAGHLDGFGAVADRFAAALATLPI